MANTNATSVTFWRAACLCVLLLLASGRFQAEEEADNERRRVAEQEGAIPPRRTRAGAVRHAFAYSGGLVLTAAAAGYLLGLGLGNGLGCSTPKLIAWLQIVGTCLLLWGTLFVRGWEIQTYGGVTLTERVNQWLYRTLYCVGTAVLVSSLAWPQCTSGG